LHHVDEFAAGRLGEQIAVKGFPAKGAGNGAVGTDQPEIKSQPLSNGQGKGVAASGDQNDFDAFGVGAAEGG
jgi:hypothetical protein